MTIDQVNKIKNYINGLTFKLITDDEVRKLSVLHCTNHRSFDENQMPISNSIHDLKLGNISTKSSLKVI